MLRSCTFIDGNGGTFEVDVEDMEKSKADLLGKDLVLDAWNENLLLMWQKYSYLLYVSFVAPFSAKLIDGINQSNARRRALMLFCFVYMNANAKVTT